MEKKTKLAAAILTSALMAPLALAQAPANASKAGTIGGMPVATAVAVGVVGGLIINEVAGSDYKAKAPEQDSGDGDDGDEGDDTVTTTTTDTSTPTTTATSTSTTTN